MKSNSKMFKDDDEDDDIEDIKMDIESVYIPSVSSNVSTFNPLLHSFTTNCYSFDVNNSPYLKSFYNYYKIVDLIINSIPQLFIKNNEDNMKIFSNLAIDGDEYNRLLKRNPDASFNWLNDTIVNDFFATLNESKKPNEYFMSTFLISKLLETRPDYYYLISKWFQYRDTNWFVNDNQIKRVFIPVNIDFLHWFLIVYIHDPVNKIYKFLIYDSLKSSDGMSFYRNYINNLFIFFQMGYLIFNHDTAPCLKNYTFEMPDCTQQNDAYNCGVYVCQFAHHIKNGVSPLNLDPSGIEIQNFRTFIYHRIKGDVKDGSKQKRIQKSLVKKRK